MADQEQLEILKQGVEVWNKWREENPLTKIDLIEANLANANLTMANLAMANLTKANLTMADLTKANLTTANLTNADLGNTVLIEANLQHADLTFAAFSFANLSRANLRTADLSRANLREADLRKANLGYAILIQAYLPRANLGEANLEGANLSFSNLKKTDLKGASLQGSNLQHTDLTWADLTKANLSMANLQKANLQEVDLKEANLFQANLSGTHFFRADLSEADLRMADLNEADLNEAKLIGVNLGGANLSRTNLVDAKLSSAVLNDAIFTNTVLGNVDLSNCQNIDAIIHEGPSVIDERTLINSSNLSKTFLRGIGLSDLAIETYRLYNPDLTPTQIVDIVYKIEEVRSRNPIQIASLFISYSQVDVEFITHLEPHLDQRGIRYWRDKKDAPAGPLEEIIVRGMQDKTLLLVLSKDSVQSDWVEWELEKAIELKKKGNHKYVLCPIAIDDSWKTANWPGPLISQVKKYHILDFSDWENPKFFVAQMQKLLKGLKLFYGKGKL